jgi:hypothetical protein
MNWIKFTRTFLFATVVIWVVYDVIAYWLGGNPATESANIFVLGAQFPQIPLAWGTLTAHFFAQRRKPSATSLPGSGPFWGSTTSDFYLIAVLGWLIFDLTFHGSWLSREIALIPGPGHGSIEMVLVGAAAGFLFFQMRLATEK